MATKLFPACVYFLLLYSPDTWGQENDSIPSRQVKQYKICVSCEGEGGGGSGTTVSCDATKSILYVDEARSNNSGDGYSWATAKKTLHAALYIANRCSNINRINVAKGIYKASNTTIPTTATRDNNFFIGESYSLYGGYPTGGGTRNHINNPTILDGEIADLYESYHVLVIYATTGNVTIDGFQIKRGFAEGTGSVTLEPGVTMSRGQGGGVYIKDAANVTIRNCAIYQNVASGNGGGIYNSNSNLTLVNTVLAKNASVDGGGLQNVAGSVANLVNCTIAGNTAAGSAAVAYSTTGTVLNVTNTIAWGNTSVWGGGGTRNISYSLVQDGNSNTNGLNVDPGFNNAADLDGADNNWFTADDGLAIPFCSPAVNRGDNNVLPSPTNDIAGNTRIFNEQIDMGAYESQLIPYPLAPAQRSIAGDETENYVWEGVTALGVTGCRIIAHVTPNGANPVQGKLRAKTFIESMDDLTYRHLPVLNRHYELEVYKNMTDPTAKITLFFSNADFNSYNQRPDAVAKMPTTDGLNNQHLRIIQFHGVSNSGQPGSYGEDTTIIDPDDADIVWSQGSLNWRVSFNTTNPESGFFLVAIAKYRFSGSGNWTDAARWDNGKIPPALLPGLCEITIASGSNCILNIAQSISKTAKLIVEPTAHLNIGGNLYIGPPIPL